MTHIPAADHLLSLADLSGAEGLLTAWAADCVPHPRDPFSTVDRIKLIQARQTADGSSWAELERQPRERAVLCRRCCRRETWAHDAVCDACRPAPDDPWSRVDLHKAPF